MLYCLFVAKVISKVQWLGSILKFVSILVLAAFLVEIGFLVAIGSVRSRALFGPGFYVVHIVLFFLGPLALANVLLLRTESRTHNQWYTAAFLCTVFAFFLVLLQYTVTESLYGIDGEGGSSSSTPTSGNQNPH